MAQAVQSLSSPLPLVAGRAALLRVYVVSQVNTNTPPPISVQIGSGSPVTVTPPPAMGNILPAGPHENSLTESYNVSVPSAQVQPGLPVQASLLDGNNNPYDTTPFSATVVNAPALTVLVYAIRLATQGNPGNITGSLAKQVFFAPAVQFIRAPQVFNDSLNAVALTSGSGGTDAEILREFDAFLSSLHAPIGGSTKALGVYAVQQSGDGESPGVAELNSDYAIAFDGNNAPIVGGGAGTNVQLAEAIAAHELGHALGLNHANLSSNCNSPWGGTIPDPPILNASGQINDYGYNLDGPTLIPRTVADYMSYCSVPAQSVWTSDLDWNYLATHPVVSASSKTRVAPNSVAGAKIAVNTPPAQGAYILNIGGSTVPTLRLFSTRTYATPGTNVTHASGTDIVQGFDILGNLLFTSQPFGTVPLDNGISSEDYFALETQITAAQYFALHSLKLTANGQSVTVSSKAIGPPVAIAQSLGSGRVQLVWDANQYPKLYLQTSDGMYYVIGPPVSAGSATIDTNDSTLHIEFCDGVKSVYATVHVLPVAVPSAPVTISSFVPTPAPSLTPTATPSPLPTPSPSAPAPSPASVVGQEMTNPAITSDFWMPNASDLQAAQVDPNDPTAWITRGVRLYSVLGANEQTSAWIELGDFAGRFGTAAAGQPWNGHYYAWHSSDGTYGEMTAGADFPTGWHEFNISADTPGWQTSIDNTAVGYIQDPSAAQLGERTDAMIRTGNVADDAFTSGTEVSYLQYMDTSGNYNFWPTAQAYNFAYPLATSAYDSNSYAVTFSCVACPSAIGARAPDGALPDVGSHRVALAGRHLPDKYLLTANQDRRSEFLVRGADALRRLRINGADTRISSMKIERFGDVSALRGFHSKQIAPGRLVWVVTIACTRGVDTHIGRFGRGTQVLNLLDAATGRLLGFQVSGRLARPSEHRR